MCARVRSITRRGCSDGGGGGGGGDGGRERMFYACLNMHLKSKSIRNDSEKMQNGGVFRRTFTYSWRAEKKQRILEQIHVIIGEAPPPPPPHRSHFPPEDMRFNDSLRCCRWNRDTDSMFTTHAISKQEGGGGGGRSSPYIKLVLYDKVMMPLHLIPFFNHHSGMNIQN